MAVHFFDRAETMSALGHWRTYRHGSVMSALFPKADMLSTEIDVCFVPQADMFTTCTKCPKDAVTVTE
jgi:hypothetical protein